MDELLVAITRAVGLRGDHALVPALQASLELGGDPTDRERHWLETGSAITLQPFPSLGLAAPPRALPSAEVPRASQSHTERGYTRRQRQPDGR
jgi:hypothetical protein